MTRLIATVTAPAQPAAAIRHADPLADLTLLLSRLQRTILHADTVREERLRRSELERAKARANVRHARELLTRLEQDSLSSSPNVSVGVGVKLPVSGPRGGVPQAELAQKKELLERVEERLADLEEMAAAEAAKETESGEESEEGEDLLAGVVDISSEEKAEEGQEGDGDVEGSQKTEQDAPTEPTASPAMTTTYPTTTPPIPTVTPTPAQAPAPAPTPTTTTTSTLRPRGAPPAPTATSTSTATSLLPSASSPTTQVIPTTTEAILDHHRAEQDALSESILSLAAQLKAQTQAFSASLEEDREVVERAGREMARTGEKMDGVTQKMGTLRRLTEGEGFWGRVRLYCMVYGLMIVLILFVGVMPKLRF